MWKSLKGPTSGSLKCKNERILSATPFTAFVTFPIAPFIPFAILLIISAPQFHA